MRFLLTLALMLLPSTASAETYLVTAYTAFDEGCDGVTASGHRIVPGDMTIAAPPSIPFGTRIEIPGFGVGIVRDRGGDIQEGRLDICLPSYDEAVEWGARYLEITFL